ncbi:MAG: permease [Clostridiales bacterium]|nr:permease [Clostridiales bacterium]
MGFKAVSTIKSSSKEMILILPPIFILLGLMDVWVPRDTMVKFMGEGSGIIGGILSFIIGSAAAGPLYVVFPVAIAFMKKGVKFSNILILIGAWSTTKIPMLLFESTSLGLNFMLTRLAVNIPIILIMTFVMTKILKDDEIAAIYEGAKEQEG